MSKGRKAELCVLLVLFLTGAGLEVLIGGEKGIIVMVLALIWGATLWGRRGKAPKKDESAKRIIIVPLLAAVTFFWTAPLFVARSGAWRYGMIRDIVESRHTVGDISWFPEELPEDVSDYRLQYLPTIAQGDGHFSIRYKSPEDAVKWAEFGRQRSGTVYAGIVINEYGLWCTRSPEAPEALIEIDLPFPKDDSFWEDSLEGTVIYVLYDNGDQHRHRADLVIVNESQGMVQLSHT